MLALECEFNNGKMIVGWNNPEFGLYKTVYETDSIIDKGLAELIYGLKVS